MGPDYITYKNVATYNVNWTANGLAAGTQVIIPAYSIVPVKNLYILNAKVLAYATKPVGVAIMNGFFRLTWDFPDPSSTGIEDMSATGWVRAAVKSGEMKEMYIMRSIPAGYSFELIPALNSFNIDVAPGVIWSVTVEVAIFYILLN